MKLHLIRHTTPDIESGICYGQSDISLSTSFATEQKLVLKKLSSHYDIVYSSPLSRCSRLAKLIKSGHYEERSELMEMNFGDWENKKWDDINQEELNTWMNNFVNIPASNGENLLMMQNRVNQFINHLLEQKFETATIVTHAGVIRLFCAWVLDIPLQNLFRIEVDYGALFEINLKKDKRFCSIRQI